MQATRSKIWEGLRNIVSGICGYIQVNIDNIRQSQHCVFGGRNILSIYLAVCLFVYLYILLFISKKSKAQIHTLKRLIKLRKNTACQNKSKLDSSILNKLDQ